MTETLMRRWLRGRWREVLVLKRTEPPYGPLNTYSNLAYVLAGAVTLYLDRSMAGAVFAFFQAMLGFGSWHYHSQQSVVGNSHDRFGMFLVFGALAMRAPDPTHELVGIWMGVGGVVIASLVTYIVPPKHIDLQVGAGLAMGSLPAWFGGDWRMALASLGLFLVAYAVWHMDQVDEEELAQGIDSIRPHPIVGVYGHALWHVLTAAAIPLMYFAQR